MKTRNQKWLLAFVLIALAIAASWLVLAGGVISHAKPRVSPVWRVELVRPDGEVERAWKVKSRLEPKHELQWGGQMLLYADDGGGRYRSLNLVAPTGWVFRSTKQGEPN